MTMTTPDENEGVVVSEDAEVAYEVAALAAEPVPREMTWAVRLIIGLIAFSAVVVLVMVLRSDDCVKYHLQKCYELNCSNDEMEDVFGIATLIGGTIVIPHLRRAVEFWDELKNQDHD